MGNLISGKGLRIEIDGGFILYATTCSLQISKEFNSVVTKDDEGDGSFTIYTADGATNATLSHSGLMGDDSAVAAYFAALVAGTSIAWKFKSADLPVEWAGNGFFSSQNVEANVTSTATLEMGIQVSGAFTCAAPV